MTGYKCTSTGFCTAQTMSGLCRVGRHKERLKCPHIEAMGPGLPSKTEIDPRKPGVADPDTPLPWWISRLAVLEMMKERQP